MTLAFLEASKKKEREPMKQRAIWMQQTSIYFPLEKQQSQLLFQHDIVIYSNPDHWQKSTGLDFSGQTSNPGKSRRETQSFKEIK